MAGANDPSLTETPEYRIVVLFVGFIIVTYLFDKLTEWVDEYLKHHKRRGLLHTIHKLEEELLALGLISLLLIAFEVSLESYTPRGVWVALVAGTIDAAPQDIGSSQIVNGSNAAHNVKVCEGRISHVLDSLA